MRLDYNEKKQLGREKVERRAVQKNRPRKEPMGLYALLVVFVLAATYGAGVFTGWFFFKGEPLQQTAAVPPAVQPAAPAPPAAPAEEEPLTFYKTLPEGGGAVMGSGMNLKLPETAPAAKPAPASAAQGTQPQAAQPQPQASQPQPQPQAAQPQAEKQAKQERQEKQEKQNKQGQENAAAKEQKEDEGRFAVQVASYRDKEEADAAQAKLAAKGLTAYLVESRLADKSVWYRLRVGRNLSKSEAGQLAAKAGKGAVLIPE